MGKNEIEHLKNIQLFSSLTDDELHQIKDKLSLKRYKKHEVILFEEDTTEYMYIILNGKTKVIQTTEDGKRYFLPCTIQVNFLERCPYLMAKRLLPR
jgi:CRP/FNR family transcriptional regulator